ncbi:MAG TPA: hypothetical protein VFB96_23895, partial [Pirellulaceae bacterium]|nr:hypothetical protein [Pirellulaceae bacterium]
LWGFYAVVKLYHGWQNLPANWLAWYGAILGVLYLVWKLSREERFQQRILLCLEEAPASGSPPSRVMTIAWLAAGWSLVAANLAWLEFRHPFTFTHDDNLSQFLPVIVHGARSLFDEGVLSTWNPHQFTGYPTASLGTYALTYPLTYLSYAAARWLLGNEYATIEIFGVIHLAAGYGTMFWAARSVGLRPALSAAAGLCFALCGFFLIGGRSWYYMLPLATWLPLVAVSIWRLRGGRVGWPWVLSTGLLLGILFHAGNAQMWIYAAGFLGIAGVYLALYGGQSWRLLVPVACALWLGLAIASPLFLPQYLETSGLERFAGGEPIVKGLFGLFVPWPLSFADRPGMAEANNLRFITQFYYAGTIFTAAAAIGLFSCLWHRWPRRVAAANVLLALGLVAFIYALGRPGMVWGLTGELPVFKQFRHPMKFLAFVHVFGILGGGLVVERLLRRFPRPQLEWLIAGACAVLMTYHTYLAFAAFFSWSIAPYPDSPGWLQQIASDKSGRLYPVAPRRCAARNYELSQMLNLPTIYGTLSLTGYDPLIEENSQHKELRRRLLENPLATLRAFGVRHVVVYPTQELPELYPGQTYFRWYYWEPTERAVHQAAEQVGRLTHWSPGVAVYEIDGAAPLAFATGDEARPLPIRFHSSGADVSLPPAARGKSVIVNVLPPRFLYAYADGIRIEHTTDEWGRLKLNTPPSATELKLLYRPPWLAGTLLGLALAVSSCAAYSWFRWRCPEPLEKHSCDARSSCA